ncbi:MAG: hypothetical protein KJO07_17490 [Deltaproteobacteria bacterium]|nr:hypothetical protein [Deltaproteobacteria bacterium]
MVASRPTIAALAVLLTAGTVSAETDNTAPPAVVAKPDPTEASVAEYFKRLEQAKLIDVDTGSKETLKADVGAAEKLLRAGAHMDAAVALYTVVESPRYSDFSDFVEYQNAEYYLAVALASAGAYDSALTYLDRVMSRGPSSLYFSPAHRRAVDIGIETRNYQAILDRILAIKLDQPVPVGASGERAYLRGRIAYEKGDFTGAEGELSKISRKSRLYSSALYLRGVIRTRKGQFKDAAEAMCEIVDTPDDDKFTFVVDDRYFTIKDLARLGLGRIAHEVSEYDDAYYHYFQIPEDSDRLPEALFEATWSMYQKRELATARDLSKEYLKTFKASPLTPEAMLLAGYVELADCKFETAQKKYDRLIKDLQPIVDEIDRIRKDPDLRAKLFDEALVRWRKERSDPEKRVKFKSKTARDKVLGLMRLDPKFVRLNDAIIGLRKARGNAPFAYRSWRKLARRMASTKVGAAKEEASSEQEEARDAAILLEDIRRLDDEIVRAKRELRRGKRAKTLPADAAAEEEKRLNALSQELTGLEARAKAAAAAAEANLGKDAPPSLAPLVSEDVRRARKLEGATNDLMKKLGGAADRLAIEALDRLYGQARKVLDKAKLGKIDSVIGQKRRLEIEVQDLAAGRFPRELHGKLWEKGLIGDDEVYWPFEGEFWKDEYEGWR